jgi:hypothetical protein
VIRILDGTQEIARHPRCYDQQQEVLHPPHQQALLQLKRKAFHSTPGGRLLQTVPESETLLDLAFARGESAGSQTAQLLKLLDLYGAVALRRATAETVLRHAHDGRSQPPSRGAIHQCETTRSGDLR